MVIFDVLGETDPSYDFAPAERWMANIKDAVPKYSASLKSGLADTMALLAGFGDSACQNLGEVNLADHTAYWVRELLNRDISARGWYSFGSNLIPIAETSPERFLEALEKSMYGDEPSIVSIFQEEGDFGGCPHSNLLCALETISWSMDYLPRVAQALARLSEIDPGGKYINRPFNSLREIFLRWINNTKATHEERIQIIDANLIKFYPDVSWRLLIELLPKLHETSDLIHQPKYRDWAEDIKREVDPRKEYQYLEKITDRLLNLVDQKPSTRWPDLIEKITHLPSKHQYDDAIDKLLSVKTSELGEEVCAEMAEKLRDTISRHREFADANWALPKDEIDKLENAYNVIAPQKSLLKYKYLFDGYSPELINPITRRKIDYKERDKIINQHRQNALVEIYQEIGIDGIKQLAKDCKFPMFIGYTIADSDLRTSLENEVLAWLENEENSLSTVARSFVSACAGIDKKWIHNTLKQSTEWSKDKLVNLFLGLPFTKDTFALIDKADEEVKSKYWKNTNIYFLIKEDGERINWVVKQLLKYERPLAAVDAAAHVLLSSRHSVSLDCKLLAEVLKNILVSKETQVTISHVQHDILEAIKFIQEQEELKKEEIVQIEWMYLGIFRFQEVKPKYLEEEVINNPAFFAQLVTWCFKSEEGEDEAENIDEESLRRRAENAWELLRTISIIPGSQEDGSINAEKLREWVLKAREQLDRAKRKKIGDDQIGQLLSKSPPGTDGIWPHEAVRDIIEEIRSSELDEGLEVGKKNLRGVTTRSPFEGGEQERELAEKYREQAERIKLKWPRTSEILRRIERSYKHEADWEDKRVELRP